MTVTAVPGGSMIPAQQNANPTGGSNFTGLLCTKADYVRLTGDTTSADPNLTTALTEAEAVVAKRCNRTLKFGQYTELLYVYKRGYVYPSALPIAAVVDPLVNQQGPGVWTGYFLPLPSMPVFTGSVPPQTNLTYWGGFTDQTIPPLLKRAIAMVAWRILHSTVQPGLPAGADSAGVAGASVHGDLSPLEVIDPSTARLLRRFTRPEPHGWQS